MAKSGKTKSAGVKLNSAKQSKGTVGKPHFSKKSHASGRQVVTATEGKAIFKGISRKAATQNNDFPLGDAASEFFDQNGSDIMIDSTYDNLDQIAYRLIDDINSELKDLTNITTTQRHALYRYFARHNPILSRVLDLHSSIPLSKIRLAPPKGLPKIDADYIQYFYERILDKIDLFACLKMLLLQHFTHGIGQIQIEDLYDGDEDLESSPVAVEGVKTSYTPENLMLFEDIQGRYDQDPDSVSLEERIEYLSLRFPFFQEQYQGPERARALEFFDINEFLEIKDTGYRAVMVETSETAKTLLERAAGQSNEVKINLLVGAGFSKALSTLIVDSPSAKEYLIDNQTDDSLPFLLQLGRTDLSSIAERILPELITWENAKRAMIRKTARIGKNRKIFTAENADEVKLDALTEQLFHLMDDPDFILVSNLPIESVEVTDYIKEELTELADKSQELIQEISLASGLPASLISGESQFSGDSIKLEILNTEYFTLKQTTQRVLETSFLKPIARRKGFILLDQWGNQTLVYPRLTFSRVSIRDNDIFQIMFDLHQKGKLPIQLFYEALNIDPEDAKHQLLDNMGTVFDDSFNDVKRDIYGPLAQLLSKDPKLLKKMLANYGLHTDKELDAINLDVPDSEKF